MLDAYGDEAPSRPGRGPKDFEMLWQKVQRFLGSFFFKGKVFFFLASFFLPKSSSFLASRVM